MGRLTMAARAHGVDGLIAVGAVVAALEVVLREDAREPGTPLWFAAPAVAVVVLVLLARHRAALAAPAVVWLLGAALAFVDGRLIVGTVCVFAAGLVASFLLGQARDARQARLGLVLALAACAIVVYRDPAHVAGDFVFTPALFGIAWLAGFAMRARGAQLEAAERRAAHAERERESAARVAVAEERARIARELHDVVAHAVSVMVLQVGAVRHRLGSADAEARAALVGVEETGRAALAEMRLLLGALRHDGEAAELAPQPGLAGLDPLLDAFDRVGLPVALRVDGEPVELPRGLDLSAYRIVQEGLTNALKHARASRAEVLVRYGADEVQIAVTDDGVGPTEGDGLGHGLVGIRERVKIYGGEMTAGAVNGRGFTLRTRLPLHPARR